MRQNDFYDIKFFWQSFATIIAMVALMNITGGAGFALAVPLAFVAAFRQKEESLFFWILFACMSILGNKIFMPKDFIYSVSNRVMLTGIGLYGGLLFLSQGKSKFVTPFLGIFVYLLYSFIPSSMGWAPTISYLKITLFSLVFMTMVYAANKAIMDERTSIRKLRSVFLAYAVFIIFGSMLLLPFPHLASLDADAILKSKTIITSLFTGMLNHSQALGPVTCVLAVVLVGDLLFNLQRADKLYLLLILCCPILIYKTSSRTAMGSFIAGLSFITFFFMRTTQIKHRWKSMAMSVVLLGVAFVSITVLLTPSIRNNIVKFAMKSYLQTADEVVFDSEVMTSTRQGLVDSQIENFHKRPAIGWGFQVSEEVGYMEQHSSGLLLTAPIEKGVWVTAVLEEGGVFGFIFYVLYFVIATGMLIKRKAYLGATALLVFHVSCLGEFSMFSMSSEGGIWYALLFLSLVFDAKRIQGSNTVSQMNYYYTPTNYNYSWQ